MCPRVLDQNGLPRGLKAVMKPKARPIHSRSLSEADQTAAKPRKTFVRGSP
jgi:hypothetical protein